MADQEGSVRNFVVWREGVGAWMDAAMSQCALDGVDAEGEVDAKRWYEWKR